MKFFATFMFSILIISCGRNASPLKTNKRLFKSHLSIVSSYEERKKSVLVDDFRKAISFLSLTTGIDSRADYSSTFGYRNRADYENDMDLWKKWYRGNSYKLTNHYVDSAFKSVQINHH